MSGWTRRTLYTEVDLEIETRAMGPGRWRRLGVG